MKLFEIKRFDNTCRLTVFGIKITLNKKFDKTAVDKKLKNFVKYGLTIKKRSPRLIVTLTSFPQRIPYLCYTIYSLLNQSLLPDEVVLWLAEEQFPNKENDLPERLLNLKENGLKIKWYKDIKSYKKLIPSLIEYPQDIIVTADDDIFYTKDWLKRLYDAYLKNPEYIHCHRARRICFDSENKILPYEHWQIQKETKNRSYLNFFTGGGGILYPPKSLYKDIFREELFAKLCPTADDIWFWTMAVLAGRKINIVQDCIFKPLSTDLEKESESSDALVLYKINITQNDVQLKNVFEHYPQLYEILQNARTSQDTIC